MKRMKMPRHKDKKVFRQTAASPKKINLGTITYRGGIRL